MDAATLVDRVVRGTYRLERPLGEGGMGMVFVAVHLRTGRRCALKMLRSANGISADSAQRFRREAEVLGALGHPGIVAIHDFDQAEDGTPFLVMDLVAGESLEAILARGPLPWPTAQQWFLQLASALACAHDAGVVHRDIKPANIVITRGADGSERLVLLDFGMAKMLEGAGTGKLTADGSVLGTPLYMSPEQACGEPIDVRADVYSAGVVLYEMVAGSPPFRSTTLGELIPQILTMPPQALSQRTVGRSPAGLDAVLARALAKPRDQRFETMRAFADAVARVAGSTGPITIEHAPGARGMNANTREASAPTLLSPITAPPFQVAGAPLPATAFHAAPPVAPTVLAASPFGPMPSAPIARAAPATSDAQRNALVLVTIALVGVFAVVAVLAVLHRHRRASGEVTEVVVVAENDRRIAQLYATGNQAACSQYAFTARPPHSLHFLAQGFACAASVRDIPTIEKMCHEIAEGYPDHPMNASCVNVLRAFRRQGN